MPDRVNLSETNVSLNDLLEQANSWANQPAGELTADQLAIINLKRIIEMKEQIGDSGSGGGQVHMCFMCATAA